MRTKTVWCLFKDQSGKSFPLQQNIIVYSSFNDADQARKIFFPSYTVYFTYTVLYSDMLGNAIPGETVVSSYEVFPHQQVDIYMLRVAESEFQRTEQKNSDGYSLNRAFIPRAAVKDYYIYNNQVLSRQPLRQMGSVRTDLFETVWEETVGSTRDKTIAVLKMYQKPYFGIFRNRVEESEQLIKKINQLVADDAITMYKLVIKDFDNLQSLKGHYSAALRALEYKLFYLPYKLAIIPLTTAIQTPGLLRCVFEYLDDLMGWYFQESLNDPKYQSIGKVSR